MRTRTAACLLSPALLQALLSGRAQAQIPKWAWVGEREGDQLGASICAIRDYDGDGAADVALGAPGSDQPGLMGTVLDEDEGRIEVRDGQTGALQYFWPPTTGAYLEAGSLLGTALTAVPSGNRLLAAGSPAEPVYGAPSGRVRTFGLADFGPFGVLDVWQGGQRDEEFGAALAGLDGSVAHSGPLVAVGAPGFDLYLASGADIRDVGRVRLYAPGKEEHVGELFGSQKGGGFGACVAAIEDLDGDGLRDLAVGSPAIGRVEVFGSSEDFQERLAVIEGGESFGSAIVSIGDVDEGGRPDLLIGEPQWKPSPYNKTFEGRVMAVSFETLAAIYTVEGGQYVGYVGNRLAVVDQEGDGALEWATIERGTFERAARVRLFEAADGKERDAYPVWATGLDAGLSAMGDQDSDGGSELLVGLPALEDSGGGGLALGLPLAGPAPGPGAYTVDDDGPAAFKTLGGAALQVPTGSTLMVRAGEYRSTAIDRSLTVIGEPQAGAAPICALPKLRVLGPDFVHLAYLRLERLELSYVPQASSLTGLHAIGGGIRIQECAQVVADALFSDGNPLGLIVPQPGLYVAGSNVHVAASEMIGGDGASGVDNGYPISARDGVQIAGGSRVVLARSKAVGGRGGDAAMTLPPTVAGAGGAGAYVATGSALDLRGGFAAQTLVPGQDGENGFGTPDSAFHLETTGGGTVLVSGLVATLLVSDPLAVSVEAVAWPTLNFKAPTQPSYAATAHVHAMPGELALLMISEGPADLVLPGILGGPVWIDLNQVVLQQWLSVPGLQIPGTYTFGVPTVPSTAGLVLYAQAFVLQGGGTWRGSNAASVTYGL